MKEFKKLPDEQLDQVSGGNMEETLALKNLLGSRHITKVEEDLKKYGIRAHLSYQSESNYKDMITGKALTYQEVLSKIQSPRKQ